MCSVPTLFKGNEIQTVFLNARQQRCLLSAHVTAYGAHLLPLSHLSLIKYPKGMNQEGKYDIFFKKTLLTVIISYSEGAKEFISGGNCSFL